jgi:RNA polymerase sigma factor (TIGR02999 family)
MNFAARGHRAPPIRKVSGPSKLVACQQAETGTCFGYASSMSDATRILAQIESGDPSAAEKLLPLVYDELRKLAAAKLAQEKAGQTLQATALVHDAYLRLVDVEQAQRWDSHGHFFAAAAEAMRRILVERFRRKQAARHGGSRQQVPLDEAELTVPALDYDLLAVDEALDRLAAADPAVAELVKLRYFAGMTIQEAAQVLGVSSRTANEYWTYAKAWLLRAIEGRTP